MVEKIFKKGSYIVLLSTSSGNPYDWDHQLPINYCYKLSRDSYNDCRGFNVVVDIDGNYGNGWKHINGKETKFKMRKAYYSEGKAYEKFGRPFKTSDDYKRKNKLIHLNKIAHENRLG